MGRDNRAFLTVIRSLGRQGIEVHVAGAPLDAVALKSKYISKVHVLSDYSEQYDLWLNQFELLCATEQFSLIMPVNDSCILPLEANRQTIELHSPIALLNDKAFQAANDKCVMNKLAREYGVNVPKERLVEKITDIDNTLTEFGFPLVLKPTSSIAIGRLEKKATVKKVYSKDELLIKLPSMLATGQVQENFIGYGVGLNVLAKEGELLVVFQHERVHEPLQGGGSSYRKSVAISADILASVKRMLVALNYTGVGMFEFKVNKQDPSKWVFIELNGRFWGSLPLCLHAGVDFPYYLYLMQVKQQMTFEYGYKEQVYCRNLKGDVSWFLANLKADQSDKTLMTVAISQCFMELTHLFTGRERSDTFVIDDLKPAIYDFFELRHYLERFSKKMLFKLQALNVNRALNRKILSNKSASVSSVLFVCKGNICRSPFAASLFQQLYGDNIKVSSSGYFPKHNRASPELIVESAREFGVELKQHRSSLIQVTNMDENDLVFIFDQENYDQLISLFPRYRHKIYFLGYLGNVKKLEVIDPYGKDKSIMVNIYAQIELLIKNLGYTLRI